MTESIQSDTTSDSEFDEHELTAEDEDEDSIAPEEDVADEEEVNSLVKESQMSLEELLASYGVSTSGLTINIPSGQTGSRPRASRAALRRTATVPITSSNNEAAPLMTSENSLITSEGSHDPRSVSPTVKRSRRSNASPSPSAPNTTESVHDQDPSGSKRMSAPVPLSGHFKEDGKENANSVLEVHESSDSTPKPPASDPASRTSSSFTVQSDSQEALSMQRASRRRILNVSSHTASSGPHDAHSTSASVDSAVTVVAPSLDDPLKSVDTVMAPNLPPSEQNPVLIESIQTSENPPDLECEESRDSVREDSYSSRFWQKAIGGGESPPSYNSDEDEDYAPSVESGHDWRGEIHVGDEYQAYVPSLNSSLSELTDWWDTRRFEVESSLLWQPGKLSETDVIRFERLFAQSVMFPLPSDRTIDDEEALFMLMRCNFDSDEALQRLRFRTVSPAEIPGYMETWSEADATAFEKGFALYNKDFKQIRDTRLRHKTVADLVHYYYLWKKSARHDEFARAYRRDKRKSPHPSMTDFMDCLVLEQEAVAEAYMAHLNDSNVSSFHLVNRFSPGHHYHPHHRSDMGTTTFHESSCATRYLSHPDPHMTAHQSASFDVPRVLDRTLLHNAVTASNTASSGTTKENAKDKVVHLVPSGATQVLKTTDSAGRGTTRTTSVSV
ncbi:Mesoderm induction early response protein 1 [Fasciola hepatica]|uniref:Mesoderm induction early response protein 1 n=1 Tax=Fasciola hepatica TaxID=6192 RepID=A0A4E0RHK7_FASHE|nr:Mesoderm induction early response protein 1 [Fasciola hepatica]